MTTGVIGGWVGWYTRWTDTAIADRVLPAYERTAPELRSNAWIIAAAVADEIIRVAMENSPAPGGDPPLPFRFRVLSIVAMILEARVLEDGSISDTRSMARRKAIQRGEDPRGIAARFDFEQVQRALEGAVIKGQIGHGPDGQVTLKVQEVKRAG